MQDPSNYGNVAFTVKEARALRGRFINLLLERDELSAELEAHRQVLEELEDLRRFLADDPTPFTATVATNGHHHSARAQAEDPEEPHRRDDTAAIAADDAREPAERYRSGTPADDARETPPDERRDETDAGDGNVLYDPPSQIETPAAVVMASDDTALASRPADNAAERPAAERRGETDADNLQNPLLSNEMNSELVTLAPAAVSHERPPQGTLMERILTAIEASDRPRRGWHLQKELGLPRVPTPELSRLVKRGFLTRHGESIYGVAGRKYEGSNT
jgi:hypothetical protein